MELQILELKNTDAPQWDAYVNNSSEGTFFHLAGWKTVLERAFNHKTFFLFARYQDEIVGVLPLAFVKSRLFGNSLSALPFCVYGGLLASYDEAAIALRERACHLAKELNVDALEFRNLQLSGASWPLKDIYATFRKEIDADHDVNLKAIPNKQRAMVRKGIKNGLVSEIDGGCSRIYSVYSESVRNLGTPVFTKRYFSILREVFGKNCEVMMITHQGKDLAGVMSFYFKGQVLPYYGGSIAEARSIKGTNDFMYWALMRNAVEKGCHLFDFGRSKVGSGPYKFKKNWGFKAEPLNYEYFLVKSPRVPEVNPNNPKYKYFIKVWKKLPLPVANTIGPFLAKSLG